jgi:hypothetical protein
LVDISITITGEGELDFDAVTSNPWNALVFNQRVKRNEREGIEEIHEAGLEAGDS